MTRHESRIRAFELLFEYGFHSEDGKEVIYDRALELRDGGNSAFAKELFFSTVDDMAEIDEILGKYAEKWSVARMDAVTKAILRLAIYELKDTDTPAKAVINEAVEIAKVYGDEKSPAFINGILNRYSRDVGKLGE